jgi:hypothetical protein
MHTLDGGYAAFATLLRADGVRVAGLHTRTITPAVLDTLQILVVANAKPAGEAEDALDGRQAFTDAESNAIDRWVRDGGALLLVADHAPFGGFVRTLSQRFGVDMGGGFASDPDHAEGDDDGQILFRRTDGALAAHWITQPLQAVRSFTGQALRTKQGTCLLALGDRAQEYPPVVTRNGDDVTVTMGAPIGARGACQAVAVEHGRGRVVVLGEAAMITAQISRDGHPFGMQLPGDDDELFALQVVRWLARGDERKGATP